MASHAFQSSITCTYVSPSLHVSHDLTGLTSLPSISYSHLYVVAQLHMDQLESTTSSSTNGLGLAIGLDTHGIGEIWLALGDWAATKA